MAVQKQDDQLEHTLQQLCEDMGYITEDLREAMNDWEEWRERVRDIRASGTMMMMMMEKAGCDTDSIFSGVNLF